MMLSETASHFSASCSSIEPKIFQALVQLLEPLDVIGNGLAGVGERAPRLVAITHYHIGPYQPQPSLDVVTLLFQPAGEALHHATDHRGAVGLIHVFCRGHRI